MSEHLTEHEHIRIQMYILRQFENALAAVNLAFECN